jgi:hypothetical protein
MVRWDAGSADGALTLNTIIEAEIRQVALLADLPQHSSVAYAGRNSAE